MPYLILMNEFDTQNNEEFKKEKNVDVQVKISDFLWQTGVSDLY